MLLGVVSDTHGDVVRARAAIQMLQSLEVEEVLHCGDIGTPEIVEMFEPWPTHFVLGNCDPDRAGFKRAIRAAGKTFHDRFGDLEIGGVKIALLHGDDSVALSEAINADRWGLVCHGHTHVARQLWQGNTLVLNPGAVHRANPHSIAIVSLPKREATIVAI